MGAVDRAGQIALPSDLILVAGQRLEPLSYESEHIPDGLGEVEVKLLPPYRSRRAAGERPGAFGEDPNAFEPADPQPIDPSVTIDGEAAVRCDTIAVNILAPDFDRRRDTANETTAKLVELACDAVNGALQRLRVMGRATHLQPLALEKRGLSACLPR